MNPDDSRNIQKALIDLEAEHGERITEAMRIHARNLNDWCEAVETGRPVGRFVAADEMEAEEAAEIVAVSKVFPFTHPRRWVEHELLIEPDTDI